MVLNEQSVFDPLEVAIDRDAVNAFETAGWERQVSTYDFVGGMTSRLVQPLLDAARRG